MNGQVNTDLVNRAGTTKNNKNFKIISGLIILGIVGVAATATIGALFANNLSEEQRIMKFFETVPSVYDCDKQAINKILGNDTNDIVGKDHRYFEKVKEVAKKINLGLTIPSQYEKKLCGYSIQMLIVLMSDALRTVKLKLIENKSCDVFGSASLSKCKNKKEQSGDARWICSYKVGNACLVFKFRITKEGKIDNCVIFKASNKEAIKMVQLVFNNCDDWKDIKLYFGDS